MGGVFVRKGRGTGEAHVQRKGHMRIQQESSHLQTKARGLKGNQNAITFTLDLWSSILPRKKMSFIEATQFMVFCYCNLSWLVRTVKSNVFVQKSLKWPLWWKVRRDYVERDNVEKADGEDPGETLVSLKMFRFSDQLWRVRKKEKSDSSSIGLHISEILVAQENLPRISNMLFFPWPLAKLLHLNKFMIFHTLIVVFLAPFYLFLSWFHPLPHFCIPILF